MARHKDVNWNMPESTKSAGGNHHSWDSIKASPLMDIRDELKALNARLACHRVPRALDDLHSLGVIARRRTRKRP